MEKLRENYRSRRGAKQVAGGNNESGDEDTEDYDLYYIGIYITSSIQEQLRNINYTLSWVLYIHFNNHNFLVRPHSLPPLLHLHFPLQNVLKTLWKKFPFV